MSRIDKSWMNINYRLDPDYRNGGNAFLDFAFAHTKLGNLIYCPCRKCHNVYAKTREQVEEDMVVNGIVQNYDIWIFHGEERVPQAGIIDEESSYFDNEEETEDMTRLIADIIGEPSSISFRLDDGIAPAIDEEPNENVRASTNCFMTVKLSCIPTVKSFRSCHLL